MSAGAAELQALASRLADLAERLGAEQTSEEDAVELAREAAELSARAGQTINTALAELGERRGPRSASELDHGET